MFGRLLWIVGELDWAFLKLSKDRQQSPCFLRHLSCGQTPIYDCSLQLIPLTEKLDPMVFKPGSRSQKDGTSAFHAPKKRKKEGNSNQLLSMLQFFCQCNSTTVQGKTCGKCLAAPFRYHMGGCQNYGPFLDTLHIRCRIITGTQKGTIVLTTTHIPSAPLSKPSVVNANVCFEI